MTDTEKLAHLLEVLRNYAEQPTCYNLNPRYEYPLHDWDIFEDGSEYGEINLARTLLESIQVNYRYPWYDQENARNDY
jgi:hypothetical protein